LEGGDEDGFEYDAQVETMDETLEGPSRLKESNLPLKGDVGNVTPLRKRVSRSMSNKKK
jgi:hypothetical protein